MKRSDAVYKDKYRNLQKRRKNTNDKKIRLLLLNGSNNRIPYLFLYLIISSLNLGCSRRYAHSESVSNPLRRTDINSRD